MNGRQFIILPGTRLHFASAQVSDLSPGAAWVACCSLPLRLRAELSHWVWLGEKEPRSFS